MSTYRAARLLSYLVSREVDVNYALHELLRTDLELRRDVLSRLEELAGLLTGSLRGHSFASAMLDEERLEVDAAARRSIPDFSINNPEGQVGSLLESKVGARLETTQAARYWRHVPPEGALIVAVPKPRVAATAADVEAQLGVELGEVSGDVRRAKVDDRWVVVASWGTVLDVRDRHGVQYPELAALGLALDGTATDGMVAADTAAPSAALTPTDCRAMWTRLRALQPSFRIRANITQPVAAVFGSSMSSRVAWFLSYERGEIGCHLRMWRPDSDAVEARLESPEGRAALNRLAGSTGATPMVEEYGLRIPFDPTDDKTDWDASAAALASVAIQLRVLVADVLGSELVNTVRRLDAELPDPP